MAFRFKLYLLLLISAACSKDLSKADYMGEIEYKTSLDFNYISSYEPFKLYSDYLNFDGIIFAFSHTESNGNSNYYVFKSLNFLKNDYFKIKYNKELPPNFNAIRFATSWECEINNENNNKIKLSADWFNVECRKHEGNLEMFINNSSTFTLNGNNVPYYIKLRLIIPEL